MTPALHFAQFGKYEIIRKLGRSMTDVYLALDPEANRRVVLKIVEHSRDSYTQVVVEAERRGALIQQQLHLKDPRILEVYEYGDQNGCFFVAMQYAEGHSLAELIRKDGRFDPMRAARYGAEICSQLETLHSFEADIDGQKRAVVHGDIKPSNIQVGPNGEVWLLDFGIAKVITATRNLTQHNLGSPSYCSPERLKNGSVDPHSDLWAVGVCLYEMIAGLPPYQAQTTRKLENLIQSRRPPRALPDDCPAGLKAIIRKTIAADPERRYPSAGAMASDLQLFLDGKTPASNSERQPAWDANATLEKPRPTSQQVSKPAMARRSVSKILAEFNVVMWSLIAGLIIGLLCFVPASHLYRFWRDSAPLRAGRDYTRSGLPSVESDWRLFRGLERGYQNLGRWSPVSYLTQPLQSRLTSAGDQVLEQFRNSTDPGIGQYDWEKARACFQHASEMSPNSDQWKGKLAATEGFLRLTGTPPSPREAESKFREAIALQPHLISPHLGLAHIYIYDIRNMGMALAEFHAAQKLGYKLGPRETEQEADGYLQRGEQEFQLWQRARTAAARRHYVALMQRDFDRARALYEPIEGYSKVSDSLERLDRDESKYEEVSAARERARQAAIHRRARYRRWR